MSKPAAVTQLYKGTIELAVLSLLARRPHYGGEIIETLAGMKGLNTSAGTIYPLLKRLATAGTVSTSWVESPAGPPRKYYDITERGHQELISLRAAWIDLSDALNNLLEGTDG